MPLTLSVIHNGVTYEKKLSSRRVQLDGEVLIVGSKEGLEDTLARIFDMAAELRNDLMSMTE